MEDFRTFEYRIRTLAQMDMPNIRFLYAEGIYTPESWTHKIDKNQCKINYFTEGHPHIIVGEKTYTIEPGDLMLYRPHDIHFGAITHEHNIEYFQLEFEPETFSCLCGGEELIRLFSERGDHSVTQIRPSSDWQKKHNSNFRKLLFCTQNENPYKNIAALTIILEILQDINRCQDSAILIQNVNFYPQALTDAIQFIHEHYHERITTDSISEAAFISRSYLNRLFQKYLHCSPYHFLLTYRLSQACIVLENGFSVTEAAIHAGFADSTSFSTAFKRIFSMTPTQYCQTNNH